MRSNKSYVVETLAFVNKHRKQAGVPLLNDVLTGKQSGYSCPVSNSLRAVYKEPYTSTGRSMFYGDIAVKRFALPLPRAVRRFVRAFDTGRLPEYHI